MEIGLLLLFRRKRLGVCLVLVIAKKVKFIIQVLFYKIITQYPFQTVQDMITSVLRQMHCIGEIPQN